MNRAMRVLLRVGCPLLDGALNVERLLTTASSERSFAPWTFEVVFDGIGLDLLAFCRSRRQRRLRRRRQGRRLPRPRRIPWRRPWRLRRGRRRIRRRRLQNGRKVGICDCNAVSVHQMVPLHNYDINTNIYVHTLLTVCAI